MYWYSNALKAEHDDSTCRITGWSNLGKRLIKAGCDMIKQPHITPTLRLPQQRKWTRCTYSIHFQQIRGCMLNCLFIETTTKRPVLVKAGCDMSAYYQHITATLTGTEHSQNNNRCLHWSVVIQKLWIQNFVKQFHLMPLNFRQYPNNVLTVHSKTTDCVVLEQMTSHQS